VKAAALALFVGATWLAASSSIAVADPPPVAPLAVKVSGLRTSEGQVGCTVYASAKGFPTDSSAALQRLWCPIANAAATCTFAPIPAGTYAVACFHDENKNGKLDTGMFGIPTEGTVASNQAKGFLGPPSFDKAKFRFTGVASELQLRMGY
jgi:uncharacterized protein (DUF2141 family)